MEYSERIASGIIVEENGNYLSIVMPDDLNMNQKLENILNVSLDATEDELRKADSLSTGYNWRDNTWGDNS